MRHLDFEVYTMKDLREYVAANPQIDDSVTMWVAPEWGEEAKPVRHIYCETSMQINHYGSCEPALIMDATPKKQVPHQKFGVVTRKDET